MRADYTRPITRSSSWEKLIKAVTDLLDERDPSDVTVTAIVGAAGISRPTFYAAFGDLPTAFSEAALHRLASAFEEVVIDRDLPQEASSDAMAGAFDVILARFDENSEFFRKVLFGPGGQAVQARIISFLAERLRTASPVAPALDKGSLPSMMSSTAIAAGVVWTIVLWLEEQPRRSVEDMAIQLRDLVFRSAIGGLGGDVR